jgi:Na+/melibiose symporter-like transporter
MNNPSQKISVVEKIGYSLGDLAANLVFQTLVTYLAYFYTDIYGLKPEDASIITLIVGLIAGFGFNPMVGALADRTRTKWGNSVRGFYFLPFRWVQQHFLHSAHPIFRIREK